MGSRVSAFLDTNVLIYRIDPQSPAKQARANELINTLYPSGQAVLSTQVLQEFYNTAVNKIRVPRDIAANLTRAHASDRTIQVTPALIMAATQRHAAGNISFWDALIVEAALASGATVLYSEDLQHGQVIDGLTITNPFLA